MLGKIVNLGMTVMACSNAIISSRSHNLIKFYLAVLMTRVSVSGLQIPATATATVVVGFVGGHVNKILFPNNGLHHKPQILCYRITIAFPDDLTWILNRELDLQILVPVGIDLQFAFPDPFGVILVNACNL